jgi:hypothetical protein
MLYSLLALELMTPGGVLLVLKRRSYADGYAMGDAGAAGGTMPPQGQDAAAGSATDA